jgi:hypothetical protein
MLRLAITGRGARDIVAGRVVYDESEVAVGIVVRVANVGKRQGGERQQKSRRYRPRTGAEPLQHHPTTVVRLASAVKPYGVDCYACSLLSDSDQF